MKYIYPAIFTPDPQLKGYYVVEFSDIEATVTQGKNFSDAYSMAEDVLNLVLMTMGNKGEQIPESTALENINVDGDNLVGLVEADTDVYRKIFRDGHGLHEVWYSPITERNFFALKNDNEDICKRVGVILAKISGVDLSKLYD